MDKKFSLLDFIIKNDVLAVIQRKQSDKFSTLQETFWELTDTEEALSQKEWRYLFKELLHIQTMELYPIAFIDGCNMVSDCVTDITEDTYKNSMDQLHTDFIKNCNPDEMTVKEMADYLLNAESETYKEGVRAGVIYAAQNLV